MLIAAPPAFWWIGATRVPGVPWGMVSGLASGAVVAGLALSPVPMLLVFAALRELPSNLYEAARVTLPPLLRLRFVLLPLLEAPLVGGFLLIVILLLGESEIPFLFGFRTAMTDIVTIFAQTFDVTRTIPLVVPLLLAVLALAALAARPLLQTVLAASRGAHGVVRKPAPARFGIVAALPAAVAAFSLGGYALASLAGGVPRLRIEPATLFASVSEPVACAWVTVLLVVAAAYPVRASAGLRVCLWAGLLLFCIPAAIFGIGWIGISHALSGLSIPPLVAHASRAVGLPLLAFAIAYSRVPRSLEDAARLVPIPPLRRAFVIVLPLLAPSLLAASALVAALTFADRDVASLLLPAGTSRLMLDLYLVSANAPSATVAAAALTALGGAALTMALAAAGPLLLWRPRG
ncbi:MAG: hypothetical protein JNM38_26040 [Acidobacteria bacterium]|nr:hypothetical protein [Acidobacteriota bacterium]